MLLSLPGISPSLFECNLRRRRQTPSTEGGASHGCGEVRLST
jgi:hypothetical protein